MREEAWKFLHLFRPSYVLCVKLGSAGLIHYINICLTHVQGIGMCIYCLLIGGKERSNRRQWVLGVGDKTRQCLEASSPHKGNPFSMSANVCVSYTHGFSCMIHLYILCVCVLHTRRRRRGPLVRLWGDLRCSGKFFCFLSWLLLAGWLEFTGPKGVQLIDRSKWFGPHTHGSVIPYYLSMNLLRHAACTTMSPWDSTNCYRKMPGELWAIWMWF